MAYVNGRGQAIEISVEDFPHVSLWTKPGAPFLCIECWTGHGDPEGFEGESLEALDAVTRAPRERAPRRHYEWRAVS